MKSRLALTLLPTLALTLLIGQITDRTTGQPLGGVRVTLESGGHQLHAKTGADGMFRFANVEPGVRTLRYSSADVPPQSSTVTVHGARQRLALTACSTTLDYSCGGDGGG
ncbi:MAG TPA: carboxypeptidase regulatory-like domain-containing protein [Candidatus Baltobacteraceae bacterium]|nr:carboxypeptidase regulatory-like domain-containing protein [Candidatus Baltobacteraceae bacterium]